MIQKVFKSKDVRNEEDAVDRRCGRPDDGLAFWMLLRVWLRRVLSGPSLLLRLSDAGLRLPQGLQVFFGEGLYAEAGVFLWMQTGEVWVQSLI